MKPRHRLLLAACTFIAAAASASAQLVELVTEATVTFQGTITTSSTSATPTLRKTTSVTTRFGQNEIIQALRLRSIIPATPDAGWSLVAVNHAPADLAYVNAEFQLYAVNGSTRIRVPASVFEARAFGGVEKYKERHLGRYILSSSGVVTNHVAYDFLPIFDIGGLRHTFTSSTTDGFATISYTTKDIDGDQEIFFYFISALRATNRGSFIASLPGGRTGEGLVNLSVSVGAAKLVPASRYPAVPTFPGLDSDL